MSKTKVIVYSEQNYKPIINIIIFVYTNQVSTKITKKKPREDKSQIEVKSSKEIKEESTNPK